MIKSMTAFARCEKSDTWGTLIWELRSVNHRYLDLHLRLPDDLRGMEGRYRELINAGLNRGKLECNLLFKADAAVTGGIEVDIEFAKSITHACEQLNATLHQSSMINVIDILKWPGVVKESSLDMKPIADASEALLQQALAELVANREREGERLKVMIAQRSAAVEDIVKKMREQMPEIRENYRRKIVSRFEEMKAELDPDRLEQELVYLVQKMDVDEELDRLESHVRELNDVLDRDEVVGRRLDFLMQELNREANTLGAKSADIRMTQASVELKVLIEQMREQIQNVE
ncbi:MAG: YicC/YloC family endoribonuclease [Gammaproteobacteria bacterium]|nr:YicC/YloC family endoribonuclease [Gammaproteobacteria bacterium]